MDLSTLLKPFEAHLKTLANGFREEMLTVRTNRPTTKLVEKLVVDAYGEKMTVMQLGSITVVPPREIDIVVWDSTIALAVAKTIETSSIGASPAVDGTRIRINLPPLTEERKHELIKIVKGIAEEQRIKIRSLRDDANKKVKDAHHADELNEDQVFKTKEKIQSAVDAANEEIETILEQKIREIKE